MTRFISSSYFALRILFKQVGLRSLTAEVCSSATTSSEMMVQQEQNENLVPYQSTILAEDSKQKKEIMAGRLAEMQTSDSRMNDALSLPKDSDFLNTVGPPLQKSFNLASYVDKSDVLQQLIKLGVDLSIIDKKGTEFSQQFLYLNLEKDVIPRVQFLTDQGIPISEVGLVITKNPYIFQRDIKDLETHIKYLREKKFNKPSITRIISRAPTWLNLSVKGVDSRLGFIQKEFKLTGDEVRFLITTSPKIGIRPIHEFIDKNFCFREEMGFNEDEIKVLILARPKIWLLTQDSLSERFQYLHNVMGLSHARLVEYPGALLCGKVILQQRHEYLLKVGRAQYDPTLPNYVSLKALVSGRDDDFCWNVARTSVADYNLFLKTF